MKKENKRISLTLLEADEIRECLESLFAMEGTLDDDFNRECHRAGIHARKLCELLYGHRHPTWEPVEPINEKFERK